MDDVASHVKLFKKARCALKAKDAEAKMPADLETLFFDAEVAMEGKVCRDLVSTIQQEEHSYLQNLAEILLFLLMPEMDFAASPLRLLLREIVANSILKPALDLVSEPDFINQTLVWLHSDYKIKPDVFSNSVRSSESIEELSATRDMVSEEIAYLRSNDSKGDLDSSLKQQLNSLLFIRKVISNRIRVVQSGGSDTDSMGIPSQIDWNQMIDPGKMKLFELPLEVLLKNNVAISYFIDYMTSIGCQSYVFFYLNIEGWKVSAEQQLQAIELDEMTKEGVNEEKRKSLLENMREAAHSIYEEYVSDRANPKLKIDESVVKRLLFKIRTEVPDSEWFDEVQESVHFKLANDERFVESFRQSYGYVKLLAELDLLKDNTKDEDEEGDELSIYDSVSLNSYDSANFSSSAEAEQTTYEAWIEAQVIDANIVKDKVKSYALYTVLVKIKSGGVHQEEEVRHVYRRYSDFFALYERVSAKYPHLSHLPFPSKKTFGNTDKSVIEKRRQMLDDYLKELLRPETLSKSEGLVVVLDRFLDNSRSYEKERLESSNQVMKSMRNSVKSVTSAVTSVPNNLIDNVVDGLSRALHSKQSAAGLSDDGKVSASIDTDSSDNIPLRILLLFMDEVFDLQERNQWLRRQIVAVLRQLIKAMLGNNGQNL